MSENARTTAPMLLKLAREKAGYVNRCTATVPFSPETIGRHERGQKALYPDDVVVYAHSYKQPDLMLRYCDECPIGTQFRQALQDREFSLAALRLTNRLGKAADIARRLSDIADNGRMDEWEKEDFISVIQQCDSIVSAFEELKLWALSSGTVSPEDIREAASAVTDTALVKNG